MPNGISRTMLDYALAYAERGLRVFPLHSVHSGDCSCGRDGCSSIGKHPRTKNGVKDATTEAGQIRQWWTHWPEANIAIATGNGLYVIDIDCAKGGSVESLRAFGISGLTWTRTVATGSGGFHLYLSCPEALPNTASKLAPSIDTRGEGGYVVAPPSRNRQGPYTWYAACEMQSMPPALLQKLKEPGAAYSGSSTIQSRKGEEQEKSIYVSPQPAPQPAAADLPPSDAPASPAASPARAHAASADLAIEARNEYLIRKAGALRADGFSAHEIYGMLLALNERRYGAGRHPHGPLSLDELERTIFKSVARWEQENSGLIVPTSAQIRSINDLLSMDLPPVNWIVPGLLSEGATLLAGKPKVGKSWLILGLAITCAQGSVQGQSVLGRYPVEPMGVLYLSLEDSPARLRSRVMKMLNGKSLPASFGYALNWKPLQAGGLQNLEEYLLTAPDTRLVIIDTLAKVRQATSGNGSTYQEDSLLMAQLQQLANAHHIALVIIHHVRKMGSEDVFDEVSGTLGLTGSADTTIVLKRPRYQNEGSLNITGRDVEEQELTLAFTPATGFWRITDSPASEQRPLNASRQAIIELLKEKGAMTPIEIAKELARPASSIRSLLSKMAGENILRKQRYGSYALLNADQTAFGEEGFFEEDTDF